MRIIPGNTKVQIEIFKGITLWDMLVGAISAIMLALIVTSTLPFKLVFVVLHIVVTVLLLARLDKEPNYMYLIHILRHFGYKRRFDRMKTDDILFDMKKRGENAVAFDSVFPEGRPEGDTAEGEAADTAAEESVPTDVVFEEEPAEDGYFAEEVLEELGVHEETKAERKARKKAEKAEYKADTKLLKSKKLSKEEEDAIWLKRAQQSQAKKEAKANAKYVHAPSETVAAAKAAGVSQEAVDKANPKYAKASKDAWAEMEELSSFTGIKDGFIEYGRYYGAAIEIPSVEFRFFSEYRKSNAINNGLGSILRAVRSDYCVNIVKIERPIEYDSYLDLEYEKLETLRTSFEEGFINEEELKSRVAIVYDRIYELIALRDNNKVVIPFYYLVLFDSDKNQLDNLVSVALDSLRMGEMNGKRLNDKELAVFLRYTNALDFDEKDIEKVRPEDYATWAMPQTVEFTPRLAKVNGMATHNFRVASYPTAVWDAWLASLMTYPSTKIVVKMKPMDSGKAITAIDKSLSELRGKVASAHTDSEAMEAQTHLETLQMLLASLQGENETLLDTNIYITAYDPVLTQENPKIADLTYDTFRARVTNMKKSTRRAWQEAGFRLNNMEFSQAVAYIGSQVSGYDPLEKQGRGIPSNTMAATFPWVFPYVMDDKGVKFGSSSGVPVFIDFFRRDSERVNSNMVIVGKSGSGKSYATKALLSNLAADDAKIFILDPEDEYTDLAKNLNGKFINVANAQFGRLNPFHIITTLDDDEDGDGTAAGSYSTHLQFLEEFFRQILPDCDRDSLEYLNSLVDRTYSVKGINASTDLSKLKPEDYPIFDDLYDEILREFQRTDNEYLKTMLRTLMNYVSKFSEGGRNAVIWNGPSSITTEENFTVFNFQSLLANRNSTVANAQMLLVLKYIDNEIIKNRDYNEKYGLNRKIIVVIDEAHVFIDTKYPVALDFMFQLAKRIRKYNGMQIVITQNIKDFVGSEEIARKSTAIINACQYSFIFALAPNDMEDLCKLYEKAGGINESEQEQIVQAQRGQAFTIMSPTSRTSFKINVPDNISTLFSDPNYRNPYFTGEGGDKNWQDYIRDSADKRWVYLSSREDAVKETVEDEEDTIPNLVRFNEVTEEEFNSEALALAKSKVSFTEIPDIPDLPEDEEDFMMLRKELQEQYGTQTEAPIQVAPAPVTTAPAAPSKTEEMLAELTLKLGSQSMLDEIKRTVREELEKEISVRGGLAVPAAVAGAAAVGAGAASVIDDLIDDNDVSPLFAVSDEKEDSIFGIEPDAGFDAESGEKEDEDESFSLGNIFDFAGLGDLDDIDEDELEEEISSTAIDEDTEDEEDDDDDDEFDIMAFLAQQADIAAEKEDEVIKDFINGTETLIDVTLEQLISYNKKKSSYTDE